MFYHLPRLLITTCLFLLLNLAQAWPGAFVQEQGHGQVIVTLSAEQGVMATDFIPARWRKIELSTYIEYGLTQRITLILAPALDFLTQSGSHGHPGAHALGGGPIVIGSRLRLFTWGEWIFSSEATIRLPAHTQKQAPWLSPDGVGGRDTRLMAGRNFELMGYTGFFDAQIGMRTYNQRAPAEIHADVTLGVKFWPKITGMLQNFVIYTLPTPLTQKQISNRIQPSLLWEFAPHWSLQGGVFVTIANKSTAREQGLVTAVWWRF